MSLGFTRKEIDDLTMPQVYAYMAAIKNQHKEQSLRLIQATVFPNMKDKDRKELIKELQQ